ncbi:enoyl-CoA hydratase/isomerase family protein [Novosphingobium flavum]|uniref:enoyl-CoA hydratase-related protein n=1 Tax=Novosphingobium aerophilum TaxID=2839843 RepID=UPI00163A23FC|nr:enoyl-CoA hydratase/isomerase family protein [Novosphingobium aerophilum]
MTDSILVDCAGPIATVTINRPERSNAMDSIAHLALSEALDRLAADDGIRLIVLTGAGKQAFSAGRDLKELAISDAAEQSAIADRWRRVTRLTDRFYYPKPIIAKVRGFALGGGFELALACDLIICSDDATFALPEPKRGLIPFAGGVHRLPRQIPRKIAMGHLLTGRAMDANRAYALGLVNEVVAEDRLDEAVAGWARDMLACAPLAIRAIRQCVAAGIDRPLRDAMTDHYPAEAIRAASQDSIEGPRAFAEKRPPVWTGR